MDWYAIGGYLRRVMRCGVLGGSDVWDGETALPRFRSHDGGVILLLL